MVGEFQFIKKGQERGFSLHESGELLKTSRGGDAPCSHVLELAERNLAAAEERIRRLQVFHDRLATLIETWKDKPAPSGCRAGGLCEIISSTDLPTEPNS